ncbi:hypothetical protein AA309_07905 [Microvirga vignae]|jgi:hypothetical protein|uniref:Uncharacterized protein n=1 Tax=Microvirga vignae TaxID=1225564 RepID=A0A0H1REG1_9HYPH|nr:hypothetical protein [Microvirga vignae]KLK93578.1 hypothetical protein AA309_07905 [Microvirga vignae]
MEHRPLSELGHVADLKPSEVPVLSKRERLDRWAELLEREPDRLLRTLDEIEWKPKAVRLAMRADNSALTVAFNDPVLRTAGLLSDRFGDAVNFFQISEHDAHIVLCSCHGGQFMRAEEAARRVRGIRSPSLWSLYFGWLR